MSPTSPQAPQPASPGTKNQPSRLWVWTRRITVGVILAIIATPFAIAAAIWVSSPGVSSVAEGNRLLKDHLGMDSAEEVRGGTAVDVRLGWMPLFLGRLVLGVLPVPPEARLAARSVREAEVSVRQNDSLNFHRAADSDLADLDAAMLKQHWNRVVGVFQNDQTVLVYANEFTSRDQEVSICIGVSGPGNRVVAGGRIRPEAIADVVRLASQHHPEFGHHWVAKAGSPGPRASLQ